MEINDVAQYVTIISALAGGIYYTVLKPLRMAIDRLEMTIASINESLEQSRIDRRQLDARMARLEQSDKSAHKRIDRLEEIILERSTHG